MVYEKLHGPNLFALSKSLAMNGFLKFSVLVFCTFMQLGQLSASEKPYKCSDSEKIAVTSGYCNPVLPGFYPDPSVCRVGEDYYLVNSTFQFFPGVPVFHSRDLIHWRQIGNVLDRESQLPLTGANAWQGIYAPTIRYNDGTYYMITTNIGNGRKSGNFFVTATDPAGPWSEPVWLEQEGIDPSLYFENGRCYLTSNPGGTIMLCEIDPGTGERLSGSVPLWGGTGGRYPESPHIYKKDGMYYLMISEGGTEMGHMVTIARSRSLTGPYEANPANPILCHQRQLTQTSPIQGTGHADLVQAHDGSWWMVFLAFRPQTMGLHLTGRETYLAPVEWNDDGWPVVNGNGTVSIDMKVHTLPQTASLSRELEYDFGRMDRFGYEWLHLRNPDMSNYRFTQEGLVLRGTEAGLNSLESPTFAAVRQRDINFIAETSVRLGRGVFCLENGPVGNELSGEAGLTVYMDALSHYDFFLRRTRTGSVESVLRYRLNSISGELPGVVLPVCDCATAYGHGCCPNCMNEWGGTSLNGQGHCAEAILRVVGSPDIYEFYCSVDGGNEFVKVGVLDARYLSTETAGGFTGIVLGLYAEGTETGIFGRFSYTPLETRKF